MDEHESYTPPLSYDQENESIGSFDSENEHQNAYIGEIAGHHGDLGGHAGEPMDDFDDFDNMDASGMSMSDDDTE